MEPRQGPHHAGPRLNGPNRSDDGAASSHRDAFTFTYTFVLVAGVAAMAGLRELADAYRDIITFPVVLLIGIATLGYAAGSIVISLFGRKWKTALSAIAAPFFASGLINAAIWADVTPTTVRFGFTKSSYEAKVQEAIAQGDERPLLKTFPWSESGGAAATNVFETLVFDESGEIAKPWAMRSRDWFERAERGGRQLGALLNEYKKRSVKHLGGNFYLVTEIYP